VRQERQEPAVQTKQPLIIRKGERLPTPEQLDSLAASRPRGEKPALLTRKSEQE
jgi:ATP-dependent RNA helicase RhlE